MHEMHALLTWVRLRDINAHSVSLSGRASYTIVVCTNLHCLVNRDTRAFIVACSEIY